MKNLNRFYLILLFLLGMRILAAAQNNPKVDIDAIINAYEEATGGLEEWAKVKSLKTIGESMMRDMVLPVVIYQTVPNKMRLDIELMGKKIVMAYDGAIGWQINPFAGNDKAKAMSEAEIKNFDPQAIEDAIFNYKAKGHTVKYLGQATIEGSETHKIKLTKKDGEEKIYYFDSKTHLAILIIGISDNPQMQGVEVKTYLSDYKKVGNIVIPHKLEVKMNDQTFQSITVKSVEINVEIDEKLFAFPKT